MHYLACILNYSKSQEHLMSYRRVARRVSTGFVSITAVVALQVGMSSEVWAGTSSNWDRTSGSSSNWD